MKRLGWMIVLALAAAACRTEGTALGAGPSDRNPFNVDCEVGWQGCYRPLDWAPVDVSISAALQKPFEGVLTIAAEQDEVTTVEVTHRFVLTPDVPVWVPLATKLSAGVSQCKAGIQDANGRTVWGNSYGLWDSRTGRQSLTCVAANELLIGVSGRMGFGLRHLSQNSHAVVPGAAPRHRTGSRDPGGPPQFKVYVKDRIQRRLPWDWVAYQGLDLLILYDPEWTALAPQQSEAIAQWVSGGGRLLVILGSNPLPRDHRLARLLALDVGEARPVTLSELVLRSWGAEGRETLTVPAWSLDRPAAWGWRTEDHGTGRTLFAWGPVGFGRAGVVTLDPASLGGPQGTNTAPFWVQHAAPLLGAPTIGQGAPQESDEDRDVYDSENYASEQSTNSVLGYLLDIPEMQPTSIVWVILLLVALALVIGPVDYFILKRRDRLPLTWLTFTVYVAGFSALAYFGVGALRSGKAQLRTVSVVDAVQGGAGAWRCGYNGIFASESDDYRLSGLARGQWWSALAPSYGRGYYGPSRRNTRNMTCAQEDGGNLPTYLPINIWSMQCLLTEEACGDVPLGAEVRWDGTTLSATVENRSDTAIRGGTLRLHGERVVRFGPIPPRGRQRVEGRPETVCEWKSEPSDSEDTTASAWRPRRQAILAEGRLFHARGNRDRTQAILDRLAQGAVVVCAEYEDAPLAYDLAARSHNVMHRQWVRLLVIPQEGPKP